MTRREASSTRLSSKGAVRRDRHRTGTAGTASNCAVGDDHCTNGKDIMTADDRLQELIGLAHAAAQPQLTEPALRERFGRRDGWPLRAGAVWRARWDDVALLALLVGNPTATTVAVTPLTFDDTGADADTLLGACPSGRGAILAVWRTLRRDLPLALLDRPVDELPLAVIAWTAGGPVPDDAQLAGPALPSVSSRSPVRADLEDDLDALIAAVPALTPVSSRRTATGTRKRVLPTEEQFAALVARLGVSLPVVLDLVDGKREPSPEEASALRDIVAITPEVTPPPAELVIEMYHPRWKATVLDLARRRDMNEAAARTVMASGAFALAARQTGDQSPDWRERLARWADAEALERS